MQKRSTRKKLHCGGYHIICIAHTNYIGVGKIGIDKRVGVCAIAIVAFRQYTEVGARKLLGCIIQVPMVNGPGTSLGVSKKSIGLSGRRWRWFKLRQKMRIGKKQPTYIARIVDNFLEISTKTSTTSHTCMTFTPRRLIFFVGPIHFGNYYWRKISNRLYLLVPFLFKNLVTVGTAKPTGINMYGIANVWPFDRINGKTFVLRLVARSRNP